MDNAVCNAIAMRQQYLMLTPPPVRLELRPSPYLDGEGTVIRTKAQLDMRRKAEILKYSGNRTSTKTNSFTKSEKWSMIVKGVAQNRSFSYATDINQNCGGGIVSNPSSSSDVPGPVIQLYEDPSMPLYMYNLNTEAPGILNPVNGEEWSVTTYSDVQFYPNVFTKYMSLAILDTIQSSYYTFTLKIPVSIDIYDSSVNGIPAINGLNVDVKVADTPFIQVFRGIEKTAIGTNSLETQISFLADPVASFEYADISFNTVSNSTPLSSFQITKQIGYLTISGLTLYTKPGYVYNILLNLNPTFTANTSYSTAFGKPSPNIKIIGNSTYADVVRNAVITTTLPQYEANRVFSMTGV